MRPWNTFIIAIIKSLPYGKLTLTMPDKKTYEIKGLKKGPSADLNIKTDESSRKILKGGSIAFAEEFICKKITTKNLSILMHYLALNNDFIEQKLKYSFFYKFCNYITHFFNNNTKEGSKRNIKYHYDLGNKFYQTWLDPSMTYSSAIFPNNKSNLKLAQINKFKQIAKIAEIKDGDKILEIGCGWGGFFEYALKQYNCNITATTISKAQYEISKKKLMGLNFKENSNVIMKDYRDLNGKYDKIISIEMFEAVGEKYWEVFFKKVRNLINKNGIISLQLITIDDKVFDSYKNNPDFIQKFIFPGGMLPSLRILREIINKHSLEIKSIYSFPNHYAKTLNIWRENFNKSYPKIQKLGFDKKFQRMWNFYLSYCESGFKTKRLDLKQIKIVPN